MGRRSLGRTGARILARKRRIPGISFYSRYADDGAYIDTLAKARVSRSPDGEAGCASALLSRHLQRYADEGDDTTALQPRYHARTGSRIGTAAGR